MKSHGSKEPAEAKQSRILIVDDDPDARRGLSMRLRADGYETLLAADAVGAMQMAQKERPDLILLDLGLPAGDGYVVLERLQTNAALATIPVIVVSAKEPEVHRIKAHQSGALAFFQKPVRNVILKAAIQKGLLGERAA